MLEQFESFVCWYTLLNNSETRHAFGLYDSYTRDRILCLTGLSKNWVPNHVSFSFIMMMNASPEETTKVMQLIEWVEFRGFFTQIANKLENILQVAKRILDGKSVTNGGQP